MSSKSLYILLLGILLALVSGIYIANKSGTIEPATLRISSSMMKGKTITNVYVTATQSMYMRGYYLKLNLTNKKSSIENIQYTLGTVSEGLGNDNKSLKAVNASRSMVLQGESHERQGTLLTQNETKVAMVTSTGDPGIEVLIKESMFYKIDRNNELIEVPVKLD